MGKLMKGKIGKLIGAGLLAASIAGCASLPDKEPQNEYEQFRNYREKGTVIEEGIVQLWGQVYYGKNYDVDGDGDRDVGELYLYRNIPCIYSFDLNDNNQFEMEEMYIDEAQDGFNGNEVRLDKYIEQQKQDTTQFA